MHQIRYMFTLVILMLVPPFLVAQETETVLSATPVSFRSQALGGTVFDDLDLVYDPVEIRYVDGIRLYTNLSNLGSGEEQVLNGVSDNEFLFGASGRNLWAGNLWTSFLVRYQNARSSDAVLIDRDLDGLTDLFETGSFRDIYTAFLDLTGNGLYDIKRAIDQTKTNFSRNRTQLLTLNNSVLLRDAWTIGLKITLGKLSSQSTTASTLLGSGSGPLLGATPGSPAFSLNFDLFTVQDNFRNFNQGELGDFLTRSERDFTRIDMALMRPVYLVRPLEVRADLGFRLENFQTDNFNRYSGSYDNFSSQIEGFTDHYEEIDQSVAGMQEDGNALSLALSVKQVFKRARERRNDGFWQVRLGVSRYDFNYESRNLNSFNSLDSYFDGSDTLNIDLYDSQVETNNTNDLGDGNRNRLFMAAVINLPLNDNVTFGLGTQIAFSELERSTRYQEAFSNVRDFQLLDTLGANDLLTTTTRGLNARRTYQLDEYRFSFPVGIEYRFTRSRNWSLRFGSIFSYWRTTENDALTVTDAQPLTVVTETGDGDVQTARFDNTYQSTSSQRKEGLSETVFLYGLGYTPTENLQIDLLGFLGRTDGQGIIDTDFFRQLRFSFTLKL